MNLIQVTSGGQTGVDAAALRVAKSLGIPTGGWMTKGWKTLDGPRPEYAALYGMRESESSRGPGRALRGAGADLLGRPGARLGPEAPWQLGFENRPWHA